MAKRITAAVNAELLPWARKSAGLELAAVAGKLKIPPERLLAWEAGKERPTIPQLRKLGVLYRRPIAIFYLPSVPKDFTPLKDFRRMAGAEPQRLSSQLRWEMRHAVDRRDIALELYELGEEAPPMFQLKATLGEAAEVVGTRIRGALGITQKEQAGWTPGTQSFGAWRSTLEDSGVLVFHTERIDVREMRGFSIASIPLPVIVLNNRDSYTARTFTMLHELTHVLLRKGGVCDLGEEADRPEPEHDIEVFCNRVAAATLMPRTDLLTERIVDARRGREWSDTDVRTLANRYGVSREALLVRLVTLGVVTQAFCDRKSGEYRIEFEERQKAQKKRGGPVPQHFLAVNRAGPLFARLVLENYHQDRITASEVSDFLAVRLRHLPKIEADVFLRRGAVS